MGGRHLNFTCGVWNLNKCVGSLYIWWIRKFSFLTFEFAAYIFLFLKVDIYATDKKMAAKGVLSKYAESHPMLVQATQHTWGLCFETVVIETEVHAEKINWASQCWKCCDRNRGPGPWTNLSGITMLPPRHTWALSFGTGVMNTEIRDERINQASQCWSKLPHNTQSLCFGTAVIKTDIYGGQILWVSQCWSPPNVDPCWKNHLDMDQSLWVRIVLDPYTAERSRRDVLGNTSSEGRGVQNPRPREIWETRGSVRPFSQH